MTEQAKIALVTGASRGIGRAIAIGMAKRGFDVAINDIERQKDALQEVAQEIEATGRRGLTSRPWSRRRLMYLVVSMQSSTMLVF
jgi:NAD(P)-dependent dehydrogenase (short-subunit alcohol dehydrogenase family)